MRMLSCWTARAVGCALGMGLVATSEAVWAQDDAAVRPDAGGPEPRRSASVRVDLGVGAMNVAGGLGGAFPVASAALEGHLAGPAWLVVAGRGGYNRGDVNGTRSSSSLVSLRVGPRLEWPIIGRFDAGFHGLATGELARTAVTDEEAELLAVGGVAGASIHYRATDVFGVRVAIDVLRGGYTSASHASGDDAWGHVDVSPSPAGELTFTF